MKKVLIVLLCAVFALALLAGCGQKKEAEPTDAASGAGHVEEMADSTRMDSAASAAMEELKTMADTTGIIDSVTGGH